MRLCYRLLTRRQGIVLINKEGMMIRKVFGLLICLTLVTSASLALAGGPPPPPAGQQPYGVVPGGPGCYGPGGNPCAFWGDAPIPGLCGGVIALPFLVVGSFLGGNTAGPCGPPPSPRFNCAPRPCPPPARGCGQPAYGPYGGGGLLGGIPVFDLTSSLVGGLTGGAGLL